MLAFAFSAIIYSSGHIKESHNVSDVYHETRGEYLVVPERLNYDNLVCIARPYVDRKLLGTKQYLLKYDQSRHIFTKTEVNKISLRRSDTLEPVDFDFVVNCYESK